MIEVLVAGAATTVQDLGRPGYGALGVPRSGALDLPAHRLANRLVGNDPAAATLEVVLGGLAVRARDAVTVALTGAVCPASVDGRPVDPYAPLTLRAGATLGLGRPDRGLRTYVGVRGGVDVPLVLGSRSTDTLSGLGRAPLRAGDVLPVGAAVVGLPAGEAVAPPSPRPAVVRVATGPRADWVPGGLAERAYVVSDRADRVGIRLTGPPLPRRPGELASEGLLPGAVQVPPDGLPVVFLADAPVTGGYPVVAVVLPDDLPVLAQLRPGDALGFRA